MKDFDYILGYQMSEGAFEPYCFCDSFEEAAEIDGGKFDFKGEDYWKQNLPNSYDRIVILKVPSKSIYSAKKEAQRKASEERYAQLLAEGYYDDDDDEDYDEEDS